MSSTTASVRRRAQLEANKAIVRSFVDAWNTRDFDRFDAAHGRGCGARIGGGVVPCDPAGTRAIAAGMDDRVPGLALRPARAHRRRRSGRRAHAVHAAPTGRPSSASPPTHRTCTVDEIVIFRIAGGKIAEAWEVYDEAGMWRQLGVVPPVIPEQ